MKIDESISVRDLSEQIAERESGERPSPRNIRQSVYVSLHQTRLPKLDDLDVVEYDKTRKTVRLKANANQVFRIMDDGSETPVDTHYLIISLVGLLVVVASLAGVPVLDPMLAGTLAGVLFVVGAGLATCRIATDRGLLT